MRPGEIISDHYVMLWGHFTLPFMCLLLPWQSLAEAPIPPKVEVWQM